MLHHGPVKGGTGADETRLAELHVWRRDKPAVTGGISDMRPAVALISLHDRELLSFHHRQCAVGRRYSDNRHSQYQPRALPM